MAAVASAAGLASPQLLGMGAALASAAGGALLLGFAVPGWPGLMALTVGLGKRPTYRQRFACHGAIWDGFGAQAEPAPRLYSFSRKKPYKAREHGACR